MSRLDELLVIAREANRETEWVEFKVNDCEPEQIGQYISALSNAAALHERPFGYIVWGVNNVTREVIGTTIRLCDQKVGNEELESWLSHLLAPAIDFRIIEGVAGGLNVSIMQIPAASHTPVCFKGLAYIRVGTYKKRLSEHPEKERALWRMVSHRAWEYEIAANRISSAEVFLLLDYPSYFNLTAKPLPDNRAALLRAMTSDHLIDHDGGDFYSVTNLGAILFARDLHQFETLKRKTLRTVYYKGRDRTVGLREHEERKGYASAIDGVIAATLASLPSNEQIAQTFRKNVTMYPQIAFRELIPNALIHQDLTMKGTGPMIEVFVDRIEITNPGTPLIDVRRFLDAHPQSRNEKLAHLMRIMNICDERGSGIDKVVAAVEVFQLPAPRFDAGNDHTMATLFAPMPLSEMQRDDRIRACYQHACLRYVSHSPMTNTSLRTRFGIPEQSYSTATRIISDTIDVKLIKRRDEETKSNRNAKYLPYWA